jgi:hypothetical protein
MGISILAWLSFRDPHMDRGMITRPIWKCPCIKLFITYFRHLEKRHPYWPETKARPILAYGPRYGNDLVVIHIFPDNVFLFMSLYLYFTRCIMNLIIKLRCPSSCICKFNRFSLLIGHIEFNIVYTQWFHAIHP